MKYAYFFLRGDSLKIGVGLSGGVDSAVSAYLLKQSGHKVKGYTMYLYDGQEEEMESAINTAKQLNIEHSILDFRRDFEDNVINTFLFQYKNGYTPNPCLICNKTMKYNKLIDAIKSDGLEKLALGHYAKKVFSKKTKEYLILKAYDNRKDQSYNLYHLTQDQIKFLCFPAGRYNSKAEIRKLANLANLNISEKPDSTGICFLGNNSMKSFFRDKAPELDKPGNIVDINNNFLGRHEGIYNYTIGQKKRLSINTNNYIVNNSPLVVIGIDTKENKIIVGSEKLLYKNKVYLEDFNFISNNTSLPFKASVKLSQWSTEYLGVLQQESNGTYSISFETPVRAPAPGQSAVLYDNNQLVGGGVIFYSN